MRSVCFTIKDLFRCLLAKIGLKDAFEAVYAIFRAKFSGKLYTDGGPAALDAMAAAHPVPAA